MSRYTYNDNCYSDLHKDARGSRPSFGNQAYWDELDPAEKQKQWDQLVLEMNQRHADEQLEERRNIDRFEYWIRNTIETVQQLDLLVADGKTMGAVNRAQALTMILDAAAAEDPGFTVEHFEWQQGLPFGYISKEVV